MKVLIVLAHPEPKSFNAAMYQTAINAFAENGHEVKTTDLYAMNFNPVYDRSNFTSVRNPDYLKLQMEEIYAAEMNNSYAQQTKTEQEKVEWLDVTPGFSTISFLLRNRQQSDRAKAERFCLADRLFV